MADEKRTYLINIESNLDEYNKQLIEAKKNLEAAKIAESELNKGQIKSREEREKVLTNLRQAQKDYSNAKKSVDLVTQANKAQSGSYEQLYKQWQLAQTQLKLMGGAYEVNEKGVRVLSQRYIEQSRVVATAKKSLDAFGKGINDNRLNVGNYSESMQGALGKFESIPGPIGRAASSVSSFAAKLASMGPIAAGIAVGILALSAPLVAFFTGTERGMDAIKEKTQGFKLSIQVLKGELIEIGEKVGGNINDSFIKWGSVLNVAIRPLLGLANFIPIVNKTLSSLSKEMNYASEAGERMARINEQNSDLDRAAIIPRAEANLKIKEARLLYADETLGIEERIDALATSLKYEQQVASDEIELQKKKTAAIIASNVQELLATGQLSDASDLRLKESQAKEIELQTESVGRQIRAARTLATARKELMAGEVAFRKQMLEEMEAIEKKHLDSLIKSLDDEIQMQLASDEKQAEYKKNKQVIDAQNYRALLESQIENETELKFQQLENDRQAELAAAEKTGADVLLIEKKYANYKILLEKEVQRSKYQVIGDFAGAISELFGKQTLASKIAAIAQATINTYLGATAAFAQTPGGIIIKSLAASAAIVQGIASVKKIIEVKEQGGTAAPTAISSSPAAQRAFAPQVQSTVLTQSQLSQSQLNALPQNNLADIIAKMPAPVVTVEDINARTKQVNKVQVRATI